VTQNSEASTAPTSPGTIMVTTLESSVSFARRGSEMEDDDGERRDVRASSSISSLFCILALVTSYTD
jgi:hypothetical protein